MKNLVIIPTYNEKENIASIIETVMSLPSAFHVLVVDDGSPDGTAQIVEGLKKVMSWSTVNAESAYDHAQMTGQFTLSTGTADKMTKLSLKLAEESIPHQLIMSKKQ